MADETLEEPIMATIDMPDPMAELEHGIGPPGSVPERPPGSPAPANLTAEPKQAELDLAVADPETTPPMPLGESVEEQLAAANAKAETLESLVRTQSAPPPPEPEPPLGPMPNPSMEPEQFETWITEKDERAEKRGRVAALQVREEVTRDRAIQDEWARVQRDHPDIAQYEDLIVSQYQAAQAAHPNLSLRALADKAVKGTEDLVAKIRGNVPTPPPAEDVDPQPTPAAKPQPGRTAGLAGKSAPPAPPTKKDEPGPPGDMVEELEKLQMESGYF